MFEQKIVSIKMLSHNPDITVHYPSMISGDKLYIRLPTAIHLSKGIHHMLIQPVVESFKKDKQVIMHGGSLLTEHGGILLDSGRVAWLSELTRPQKLSIVMTYSSFIHEIGCWTILS